MTARRAAYAVLTTAHYAVDDIGADIAADREAER